MYLKTQVKKNSLILMSKVAIVWLFIVLLEAKINLTNMMKMKINQIELQDSWFPSNKKLKGWRVLDLTKEERKMKNQGRVKVEEPAKLSESIKKMKILTQMISKGKVFKKDMVLKQ